MSGPSAASQRPLTNSKEQAMNPIMMFRFPSALQASAAALLVFGLQCYAQGPTTAGIFVTFDVPGAVGGTFAAAINNEGVITGSWADANGTSHGYLRAAHNGTFT